MNAQCNNVDAVLMASGFSRRFGEENKLLAPFMGKPLLHYPLTLLCNCGMFRTIFVVAHDHEVKQLAKQFPVTVLHNSHPQHGSGESVRLGVQASLADYYMFFPCDQPLLNKETIHTLIKQRKPACIVQPCYENRVGSPVLFSSFFREELCSLAQDEPPRNVLKRHPNALIQVALANEFPLLDVDTPEDLLHLAEIIRRSY